MGEFHSISPPQELENLMPPPTPRKEIKKDFRKWNQISPDQGRSDSSIPKNPKVRSVNISIKLWKPIECSRMFYNHLEGSKRNQKWIFENRTRPPLIRGDLIVPFPKIQNFGKFHSISPPHEVENLVPPPTLIKEI